MSILYGGGFESSFFIFIFFLINILITDPIYYCMDAEGLEGEKIFN